MRVVVAGDSCLGAAAVCARIARGVAGPPVLREEPAEWPGVAGERRAHRGGELAIRRREIGRVVGDGSHRLGVEDDVVPATVTAGRAHTHRLGAQTVEQRLQEREREAVGSGAQLAARTHGREGTSQRGSLGGIPRGLAVGRVGAVEDQRAQPVAVAPGEDLAEERAVGVAVHVHPVDLQSVEHGGEVISRGLRPIEVRAVTERAPARAHGADERHGALIELRAGDDGGASHAALVDEKHVVIAHEIAVHLGEPLTRSGRAVAGTAFMRDERADRAARRRGNPREANLQSAGHATRGVPRPRDRSAPGVAHDAAWREFDAAHAQSQRLRCLRHRARHHRCREARERECHADDDDKSKGTPGQGHAPW